jgi:hypothetical protein
VKWSYIAASQDMYLSIDLEESAIFRKSNIFQLADFRDLLRIYYEIYFIKYEECLFTIYADLQISINGYDCTCGRMV